MHLDNMAKAIKLQTLADRLEENMDKQEELKAELKPLEEEEDAIREELIADMTQKGLRFIKTESGLGFGIQERKTLGIKSGMENVAEEYFRENYPSAFVLHKPTVTKIIKPMLNFPEFIEEQITRSLSVRATESDD